MRNFLTLLIVVFALFGCSERVVDELPQLPTDGIAVYYDPSFKPFYHGVASGDPLSDRVIIWTRVTPEDSLPNISVDWRMSKDAAFSELVASGTVETSAAKDYTVKVDVVGLESDQKYYYDFTALGSRSIVGQTKTSPESEVKEVKLGVVSCSNYEWGYFTAYKKLSEQELDAVLHLGDYIYEYGPGSYGDTTLNRVPYPAKEIVTLEEYRLRYSQYRLDPDLRAAHQAHAFITIWDDHEIANDSYVDGAKNHQPDEGDYMTRKEAARKAYYEWLPVRQGAQLYRTFNYGDLADVIMLDERLAGRVAPATDLEDPVLKDTARSMLGTEQFNWLEKKLMESKATWKVIGNQVIFSALNYNWPDFKINLDSWDGYPAERLKIANIIRDNGLENVIFVTGDTHSSWAFEVSLNPSNDYGKESEVDAFAIEFGTTSISSSNSDERYPKDTVLAHEKRIVNSPVNPHLKYANLRDHGYLVLTLSEEAAKAEWYYVESVVKKTDVEKLGKTIIVPSGSTQFD